MADSAPASLPLLVKTEESWSQSEIPVVKEEEGALVKLESPTFPGNMVQLRLLMTPQAIPQPLDSQVNIPISFTGEIDAATSTRIHHQAEIEIQTAPINDSSSGWPYNPNAALESHLKSIDPVLSSSRRKFELNNSEVLSQQPTEDAIASGSLSDQLQVTKRSIENLQDSEPALNRGHKRVRLTLPNLVKPPSKNHPVGQAQHPSNGSNQAQVKSLKAPSKPKDKRAHFKNLLASCPLASEAQKNKLDVDALELAVRGLGIRKLHQSGDKWRINGFNSTLLHYQITGVHWMSQRERSEEESKGGLLADEMGLGKTVQCLALIHVNRDNTKKYTKGERSTLIICPPSLVPQWASETDTHGGEKAFRRGVTTFLRRNMKSKFRITNNDIVIASYSEVVQSYAPDGDNSLRENVGIEIERGILHQIRWHRIIADEAHIIKNRKSLVSRAVIALQAVNKWAITGTPIMNRNEEFYPLFHWLGLDDASNFKQFKKRLVNFNMPIGGTERLDAILAKISKARFKDHEFLGRPLLHLPQLHREIREINFEPGEEILYRAVEDRFREVVTEQLELEDDIKTLNLVIVQTNDTRQMTAHPMLIESSVKGILPLEQLEALEKELLKMDTKQVQLLQRVRTWIEQKKSGQFDDHNLASEIDEVCVACGSEFKNLQIITICKHIFCKPCLGENSIKGISEGNESDRCPHCGTQFEESDIKKYKPAIKSPSPSLVPLKSRSKGKEVAKKMGRDARKFSPATQDLEWLNEFDDGMGNLFPSTKLKEVEKQIKAWLLEAPNDKIIIFTQWVTFAGIIGRVLERLEYGFVYFLGEMSQQARDNAIRKMKEDNKVKIMIATPRTAGVGLNLQFANRVIIVDLWWNECLEEQALGRIHRIGQEKETYLLRIVIKNTVDTRILKMQERKKNICGDHLKRKDTPQQMASLLGRLTRDNEGHMRIVADYYEEGEEEDNEEETIDESQVEKSSENDTSDSEDSDSNSNSDSNSDFSM